jgi:hypothetical protein
MAAAPPYRLRPHTGDSDNPEADPPPYSVKERYDGSDMVEAVILVLGKTFIHAECAANVPLYQLSRDLGGLGDTELSVAVSSLYHKVRVDSDGTPHLRRRTRHIFDLKHLPPAISPNFTYCLDWTARKAADSYLALKTPSGFHRGGGLKLVRTKPKKEDGFPKGYHARRRSVKEVGQVFEVQSRDGALVWADAKGKAVAVENHDDGQQKLMVVAPLSRETLDALVGGWCLRIWHDLVKAKHASQGWREWKSLVRYGMSPLSADARY